MPPVPDGMVSVDETAVKGVRRQRRLAYATWKDAEGMVAMSTNRPRSKTTRTRLGRTVLEYVDEAVAVAGSAEEYATPDSALRWLLVLAWDDLQKARSEALNGRWSMACDQQVCRIVGLTRLVGPLPWEQVQVDLILEGVYERVHEALGTPTPLSDDDRQRAWAVKP